MAVVANAPAAPLTNITKVNLFLQCLHLPNLDVASKSDPQVTVTLSDARGIRVIGQTEIVSDNLSPKFATAISLDYYFEEVQTLTFEVHDVDAHSRDYIGQMTCTVGDIFGSRGQELVRQLAVKHIRLGKPPVIIVRGEEVRGLNANVNFKMSGSHLDKKDFGLFAKSDPYLLLYKEAPDGTRTLVHRTNTVLNTLDPLWQPFTIHMSVLCNGDPKTPLYIEVFDWDKHSADDLIGICRTSLEILIQRPQIELINPAKQKKKGSSYRNSGVLQVIQCDVVNEYTFLEYLAGGCQLNLMVGIDYTASNGNPSTPGSLHFRDPSGALNQYGNAIFNVGNILMPYDYDGQIPVYGFGGRLPNGQTSHSFALTGNPAAPEVPGVSGVMDAYNRSFEWVSLHGPTNFAPLIKQASQIASQYHALAQDVSTYLLLLIITDGEITDMNATIDAIVEASALPLSIVIVGVGNADFTKMNFLDGDGKLLQGSAGVARRDIVQFVPYNKFRDPVRLAAATLAELPGQFVSYMKAYGIKPKNRIVTDVMSLVEQVQSVTITTTTVTDAPQAAPGVVQITPGQPQGVPMAAPTAYGPPA